MTAAAVTQGIDGPEPDVLDRSIDRVLAGASLALISGCFLTVVIAVFFRYALNNSLVWADELARWFLMGVGFIGGALAYRRKAHIGMPFLLRRMTPMGARCVEAGTALTIAAFCAFFCYVEISLYLPLRMGIVLPGSGLPQGWFSVPVLIGMAIVSFSAFRESFRVPPAFWVMTAVVSTVVAAALLFGGKTAVEDYDLNPLILPWVIFCALLLMGFPIAFAMGIAGFSYLAFEPGFPVFRLVQQIENGVDSFFLLTIPLFILTGKLLEATSVSDRLLDLVKIVLGRLRGGTGLVSVGGMYLFSGISGSPTADISAVGSVMVPALKKQGYSEGEAVGIISAATVMGHTVPPSIAVIVLAQLASLSAGTLFVAGLIPAVFLALVLAVYILFSAYRQKLERNPSLNFAERMHILWRGLPAMAVPVVLFGGLFTGIVTPTETAALAVLASIIIVGPVLRELNLSLLVRASVDSATLTGMALFLLATANLLAFSSVDQQLPQAITDWIEGFASQQWEFLLLSLVILVVMGAVLEFPALLIFGPLMLPVAVALGFNAIHYAIFLINALIIGGFLPPIGVLFYVTVGIAGTTAEKAAKQTFIYLALVSAGMLIVGFFPEITLGLPRYFGMIK